MNFRTLAELELGLVAIQASPADLGRIEMVVRRPRTNQREILEEGELDPARGLVGDAWGFRGAVEATDYDVQLTLMNSRTIALIAGDRARWALAGDQLYVDLDLSLDNLPPGSRLSMGSALVEVSAEPHTGCRKFIERFGVDAQKFVNSPDGRRLNLRGVNARVIHGGVVRAGDVIRKVADIAVGASR